MEKLIKKLEAEFKSSQAEDIIFKMELIERESIKELS